MARAGVSRARILGAAREEFGKHGFSGSRVARIARRARVNKQLIFYYFGSKQGLHDEVVADAAAAAGAGEKGDSAGPGQLHAPLNHLQAFLASHPEVVAVLMDRSGNRGRMDAVRAAANDLVSPIRRAIADGQGLGYFRDDADPKTAATQALALCLGYIALREIWPDDPAISSGWTKATRDLFARGLAW